jgi:Ca2+-binding EF-hand superfamily protein
VWGCYNHSDGALTDVPLNTETLLTCLKDADTDNNGFITKEEVLEALKKTDLTDELHQNLIMAIFDENEDGRISMAEFQKGLAHLEALDRER